jgi:site-specific DNA-methyltransferase (adenine-specific)
MLTTHIAKRPRARRKSAEKKFQPWWRDTPPRIVSSFRAGDVVCDDALACLKALQSDIADIIFLDPPFNLGKVYNAEGGRGDRLEETLYEAFMKAVINESERVLRPGGAIFLYHIPRWAIRFSLALEAKFEFQHWIAVSMKNGFVRGRGLYPAHYALLHYTKGAAAVLNRPKIPPATCPHCDEYIRDYGGYRAHVENGVNLSDVWDDLSPVRHSKYKHRTANELPLALLRRVIAISGSKGGLLVDPFSGTGTSVIAARLGGMKFIGCDREQEHCDTLVERLHALSARKRASQHSER